MKIQKLTKKQQQQIDSNLILADYKNGLTFVELAAKYSLSRSGVHLRLKKLPGYEPAHKPFVTPASKEKIVSLYQKGFITNDGQLDALCKEIGMRKSNVARYAQSLGLTNLKRTGAKKVYPKKPPKEKKPYVHSKGMLGKKHTEEVKAKMSKDRSERMAKLTDEEIMARINKGMQTKMERYGKLVPETENTGRSWKAGWRTIGGQRKYFRSKWEANYARVLEWRVEQGIISTWQHEPETFWFLAIKRGIRSYLPDFRVTYPDGRVEYHEVKGWMDDRSKTILSRMKKYHPTIKIVLIEKDWFKANQNFKMVIKGWE